MAELFLKGLENCLHASYFPHQKQKEILLYSARKALALTLVGFPAAGIRAMLL